MTIIIVAIYLQLFLSAFLQSLFKPVCFGLQRLVLEGEGVDLVLQGRRNGHTTGLSPLKHSYKSICTVKPPGDLNKAQKPLPGGIFLHKAT